MPLPPLCPYSSLMRKRFWWLVFTLLLVVFTLGAKEQILNDHFQIIYDREDREAALEVASFSEEVYEEITTLLDHYPKGRIPVILIGQSATSNGYYSPLPHKIALYLNSPADRFLGSSAPWLKTLFTHELTHYIHLTSPVGIGGSLSNVFGPGALVVNSALMPGYWIEGITTYMEQARGAYSHFALNWRAPLVTNTMWSINQGVYGSSYPPTSRIYVTGYLMVNHLISTYGREAFLEVNRKFTSWPLFGLSYTFKRVLGKSAKELFGEALSGEDTLLYRDYEWNEIITPDGDYYLPYLTDRGLLGYGYDLDTGSFVYRLAGESITKEAILPISSLAFSGDGETLYFTHYWTKRGDESYRDIYRYHLLDKSLERITSGGRYNYLATNWDGSKLIATDKDHTLVEVGSLEELAFDAYQPIFSPDGKRIAFIEVKQGLSTVVVLYEGNKTILWEPALAEVYNLRFNGNSELLFSLDLDLYSYNLESGALLLIGEDPIGITGGVIFDNNLYYSTYTSKGFALRELPLLSETVAELPPPGELPLEREIISLEGKHYVDWPRFSFWLPSLVDELSPGATLLFVSPLNRHTVLLSGGYSLEQAFFSGEATYQLDLDFLSLSLDATFGRQQTLSLITSLPIYNGYSPKGLHSISTLLGVGGVFETKVMETTAQVGYAYTSYSAPKDYYGRWKASLTGAFYAYYYFATQEPLFFTRVSLGGQIPLGRTHQAIELKLDTAISHQNTAIITLLPDYLDIQRKVGLVKGLVTLRYRLPLGLFDYPIPFGGITALGLTIGAQTALYLYNTNFDWEEDVYLSLALNSDIAIGTTTIHPSIAMASSVREFKPALSFSLNLNFLLADQMLTSPL